MTIDTICASCIEAIRNAGYNDSTIFNYEGVIRRFKTFCKERGITEYSCDIGKLYAGDVISKITGNFSLNRFHTQGRFISLVNSYFIQEGLISLYERKEGFHPIIHTINLYI